MPPINMENIGLWISSKRCIFE